MCLWVISMGAQIKLYEYKPKFEDNAEMQEFIEMCFDPDSPMSGKQKDMFLQMMTGGGIQSILDRIR